MQIDQRGRGLGQGDVGHRWEDAEVREKPNAGSGPEAAEGDVAQLMFGIVSVGAHETLEIGGRRAGYQMGVVDRVGNKYFVEIPEDVYNFLSQAFSSVEGEFSQEPQQQLEEASPTGSEEEIAMMKKLLENAEAAEVSPMASIGFVSEQKAATEESVILPNSSDSLVPPNPVDELLSLAGGSQYDEDDDFDEYDEDEDEEPDLGEDIGQL